MNGNRYYPILTVTLAGRVGLFSRDFLHCFLFFELMSLASYVLVIHEETVAPFRVQVFNYDYYWRFSPLFWHIITFELAAPYLWVTVF